MRQRGDQGFDDYDDESENENMVVEHNIPVTGFAIEELKSSRDTGRYVAPPLYSLGTKTASQSRASLAKEDEASEGDEEIRGPGPGSNLGFGADGPGGEGNEEDEEEDDSLSFVSSYASTLHSEGPELPRRALADLLTPTPALATTGRGGRGRPSLAKTTVAATATAATMAAMTRATPATTTKTRATSAARATMSTSTSSTSTTAATPGPALSKPPRSTTTKKSHRMTHNQSTLALYIGSQSQNAHMDTED